MAVQTARARLCTGPMGTSLPRARRTRQCQYEEMDLESKPLAWWTEAVFHDWRPRPAPRAAKLAAAIWAAIDRKTLAECTKIPAARVLAAAVGTSRGTVVACCD